MRKWGKRMRILALAVVMVNKWCWEESPTGETNADQLNQCQISQWCGECVSGADGGIWCAEWKLPKTVYLTLHAAPKVMCVRLRVWFCVIPVRCWMDSGGLLVAVLVLDIQVHRCWTVMSNVFQFKDIVLTSHGVWCVLWCGTMCAHYEHSYHSKVSRWQFIICYLPRGQ